MAAAASTQTIVWRGVRFIIVWYLPGGRGVEYES
jgi:hypothetical protein